MIERDNGPTFALVDTVNGTTKWVPLRGQFQGYLVDSYDPQRQLLVLSREGARTELTLTSGKSNMSARPAQDELRSLTGFPLAEALVKRGDAQMKDLMAQHRAAVLRMEDLSRRLAEAEKAEREGAADPAAKGGAPRPGVRPSAPAVASSAGARKAFEDAEQQAAGLAAEIEKVAVQKRDAMVR